MLRNRQSHIGLDIGAHSIKAAQVTRRGKTIRVHGVAVIPHSQPGAALDAAAARRVRDVLARQGFNGDRVVITAPADKLHVELLELPPRHSGAPVDQLARVEMMRVAKLEGNAFEMETWDLPAASRGGSGTAVMAVAARHSDTEAIYHAFEQEGLFVEAIDVQACAITRACAPRLDPSGVTTVLDLGHSRAALMFLRGGVVVFQRSFAYLGMSTLQAELTKRLGVDAPVAEHLINHCGAEANVQSAQAATVQRAVVSFADSLAGQIESSFNYITHRYGDSNPATVFVVGGGSMSNGLREALKARVGADVEPLAPLGLTECSQANLELCSDAVLTTALGLALYEGA